MDKKNKRESRQTGMTDKRVRGLERLKEQKESGLSRLDQARLDGEIGGKGDIEDDYHEDDQDNDFVVDEEGNAVRYENDPEEEVEKVNITAGPLHKFLKNMNQGTKNPQIAKVDKSVVQAKKKAIGDLMVYLQRENLLSTNKDADLLFIRLDKNRNGKIDFREVDDEVQTLY